MLQTFEAFTQELQAEINHQLLEEFQRTEETDWARFGKARNRIEKQNKE
jgi:hypothetical protein